MYERYSLAELGEVSKRYIDEFGVRDDVSKNEWIDAFNAARGAARAWRSGAGVQRTPLRDRAIQHLKPLQEIPGNVERTSANLRDASANLRGAAEVSTENVRGAAQEAKEAVQAANQAVQNTGQVVERTGRASRNLGWGLGATGLGAGGLMAGYAYHDSKRQGGNVKRDKQGRLQLSSKGRKKVVRKAEERKELANPSRKEKREAKSLAAHEKRIAGLMHNTGPQNYRPGLTVSPFTHTEVRRDSTTRRVLRPTAGYFMGGMAGRGVDAALAAATKGKYKKKFGSRIKGKYGRWGGRLAGTSAGFTQNVRSGDVEAFRRSTGEQPRYKVMVPAPFVGRGVFYAGSKPAGKE